MKIGVKVGDIMTRNFVSAKPEIIVLDAINLMVKNRVGSVVLIEDGELKGILTEKDIMWTLSKKHMKVDLSEVKAGEVCTRKITTIRPSADIYDALKLMKKAKFRRLPVVVKKRVIGLLTLKDILRIEPDLFDIAHENYIIKEESEKLKRKERGENYEEGACEKCGSFDILITNNSGELLCSSCLE